MLSLLAVWGIGLLVSYCVSKNHHQQMGDLCQQPWRSCRIWYSLAVGVAFFVFGSSMGIFNTYLLLIACRHGEVYPFASRSAVSSMMQLSGGNRRRQSFRISRGAKRMLSIIIDSEKLDYERLSAPFITCVRELARCSCSSRRRKNITTMLVISTRWVCIGVFKRHQLLILIVFILICNALINK